MNNYQNEAITIETIMKKAFNCERNGIDGLVNSDIIRLQPYDSMISALTKIFGSDDDRIHNFSEKYACHKIKK